MIYATFEDYQTLYYGNKIGEQEFEKFCFEASRYLDKVIQERLHGADTVPESVTLAVCAVADALYEQRNAEDELKKHMGVKSANTDGYSVTYEDQKNMENQFKRKKWEAMGTYLPPGHPLRYAGVR